MNFTQALALYNEGKKIRLTTWKPTVYIARNESGDRLLYTSEVVDGEWETLDEVKMSGLKPGDKFQFGNTETMVMLSVYETFEIIDKGHTGKKNQKKKFVYFEESSHKLYGSATDDVVVRVD